MARLRRTSEQPVASPVARSASVAGSGTGETEISALGSSVGVADQLPLENRDIVVNA